MRGHNPRPQGRRPRRCFQQTTRTPQDDLDMVLFKAAEGIIQFMKAARPTGPEPPLLDLVELLRMEYLMYDPQSMRPLNSGAQAQVYRVKMVDGTRLACKKYTIKPKDLVEIPNGLCHGGLMEFVIGWLGAKGLYIPGVLSYKGAHIKLNQDTGAIDVLIVSEMASGDAHDVVHGILHNPDSMFLTDEQKQLVAGAAPGSRAVHMPDIYILLFEPLEGIAELHHLGVLHGDHKFENVLVLLTDDGHVLEAMVADLGGSDFLDDGSFLCSKPLYGTPAYMSPSRRAGHSQVSVYDDVYSWGKTAIEALTGCMSGPALDDWACCAELPAWLNTPMHSVDTLPPEQQAKGLALMHIKQQGLAGLAYIEMLRIAYLAMTMSLDAGKMEDALAERAGKLIADLEASGATPYVVLPGDVMPCAVGQAATSAAAPVSKVLSKAQDVSRPPSVPTDRLDSAKPQQAEPTTVKVIDPLLLNNMNGSNAAADDDSCDSDVFACMAVMEHLLSTDDEQPEDSPTLTPLVPATSIAASTATATPSSEAMTAPSSEAVTAPSSEAVTAPNSEAVTAPSSEAVTAPNSEAVTAPSSEAVTAPSPAPATTSKATSSSSTPAGQPRQSPRLVRLWSWLTKSWRGKGRQGQGSSSQASTSVSAHQPLEEVEQAWDRRWCGGC